MLLGKKQAVGHLRLLFDVAREAIGVLHLARVVFHIQAGEQAAVEEGNVFKQRQRLLLRLAEQAGVAVEVFNAVLGTVLLAGCGPNPGRCALGAKGWPLCGL